MLKFVENAQKMKIHLGNISQDALALVFCICFVVMKLKAVEAKLFLNTKPLHLLYICSGTGPTSPMPIMAGRA